PTSALVAPLAIAAEDPATQSLVVESAFNLLMDRYVHPLNSAELLRAGWDQLAKDASGKAADPGPPPAFTGDRSADLDKARNALTAYAAGLDANADGFVAAHALVRGMVRFVNEGHTYFLDPQQYQDYQA